MIELENVFSIVWRTCWQSAVLVVAIGMLTFIFRDRIAPKWKFLLWGLVLCRLAMVVAPSSPSSGFNLLAFTAAESPLIENAPAVGQLERRIVPSERNPVPPSNEVPNADTIHPPESPLGDASTAKPTNTTQNEILTSQPERWTSFGFFGLWLFGFLTAVCYLFIAQLRLSRRLAECCEAADEHLLATIDSLCNEFKVRHRPKLLISPRMTSPFACGIWRPSIVLPEYALDTLSNAELRCVLAHELAHIQRRDMLTQWCALAISSLYWFHPAAWLATFQMRRCREGACDDLVMQKLGDSQKAYGRALLQMAEHLRAPVLVPALCGLFGSQQPIGERIKRVTDFRNVTPFGNGMAIAALLFIIAIGMTDAIPLSIAQDAKPDKVGDGNSSVSIRAANDKTITGQCIRAADQSPVADARIVLYEVRGILAEVTKLAETTSDEDGKFAFKNLRPMTEHRFDKTQYAMIAFADGLPHSYVNPIFFSRGLDKPQRIFMNKGPVTIPGRVVDEQGDPVVGAIVQSSSLINAEDVGAVMATTDQNGEFALKRTAVRARDANDPGTAYLMIRHPDFKRDVFSRTSLKHSVFTLKKFECVIQGNVIDADTKQPIADAVVSAIPFESGNGTAKAHVKTDKDGKYVLKVSKGKYKVMLDDDMHRVAKAQIVLCRARKEPYALPTFQAQAGGWIVGRITNTKTNEPVVFSTDVRTKLRVCVGLFGPNRPQGRIVYTDYLAEVDDNGFFRMRAYPGENYPYVCNMHCSRNTFTTMKQPAVIVEAGKETRCDIPYTPALTAAEKMANAQKVIDGLPTETDARVAGIIEEFRKLNQTVDECEVWCSLMRELVNIGDPAVPALCEEFETTDQQRMMRRLAFALRAIGDPRAIPTLIRVLPKTLQPSMSDYGLIVENAELARFMRKHQKGGGRDGGNHFNFGRPVRELNSALEKLTGHKMPDDYMSVSKSKEKRALAKQEKLYYDTARDWANWWEANWKSRGVDREYSQVNLPPFIPLNLDNYPKGLKITDNAELASSTSEMVLTPVGDADTGATFFLDLDTGQDEKWPKDQLPALDPSEKGVKNAMEWAAKNNVDLLCTTLNDDPKSYVLLGINLQLWEIDSFDAKNIEEFLETGELPKGRPMKQPFLLQYDAKTKTDVAKIGSSFMYVTRDQGLGVITITDVVTRAKDITGMFNAPKGVGFHRGVRFDYKTIVR